VNSYPRSVTQAEIAAILGITAPALSGYLIGRIPGRETALRLSRDHGIDLEGLLDPGARGAVA
jgi:predicted transcriptional regulator